MTYKTSKIYFIGPEEDPTESHHHPRFTPQPHINHTVTHLTGRVTTLVLLNISLSMFAPPGHRKLVTNQSPHCSLSNPVSEGQFLVSEEHLSAGPGPPPLTC